jgi:hypothetical protein
LEIKVSLSQYKDKGVGKVKRVLIYGRGIHRGLVKKCSDKPTDVDSSPQYEGKKCYINVF